MSKWFHLKDKANGAEQIVSSLDGIDLDTWEVMADLDREPVEHEEVVGGKLKLNKEKKDKADKRKRYRDMDKADLMDLIDAMLQRIEALEKRK